MAGEKTTIGVNLGVQGMNRTAFNHQLDEKVYSFMLNGNIVTDEEGGVALTNEHSNLLCSRFKPGFKVIGNKVDTTSDIIYFFLHNETTKVSEIGKIAVQHTVQDLSDKMTEHCNCSYEILLEEPLEDTVQFEGCEYETIISDYCNKCLNFDMQHPIKDIVIKKEKYYDSLYWTDDKNPPRYLQLDNLEQYKYKGTVSCGKVICDEDLNIDDPQDIKDCATCLDCEKLNMFKSFKTPDIKGKSIQFGGRLKMGTYEFYLAYSDKFGNELSEYVAKTNPIPIFNQSDYVQDAIDIADETNSSIALKIEGLDPRFNYYKIVVIQTTDINFITSYFVEGVHPIAETDILYTTDTDKPRTTSATLTTIKPFFKTWGGMTAANNYLFGYNYTTEKEWNLQPVVNLLGGFFRWQTHAAEQNIYEDGVLASKFKEYMRDEVYPLSISFGTDGGYWTAKFPLPSRPATTYDVDTVVSEEGYGYNKNTQSVLYTAPNCATVGRRFRWQYENTATEEGIFSEFEDGIKTTTEVRSRIQAFQVYADTPEGEKTDVIDFIPEGELHIPVDVDYTFGGFQQWFNLNKDLIKECCNHPDSEGCPVGDVGCDHFPPEICNIATDSYSQYGPNFEDDLPLDICWDCTNEQQLDANQCMPPVKEDGSDSVYVKRVIDETYYLTPKDWPLDYKPTKPFGEFNMYVSTLIDNDGDNFITGRLFLKALETKWIERAHYTIHYYDVYVKRLTDSFTNYTPLKAETLLFKDDSPYKYFLGNGYEDDIKFVDTIPEALDEFFSKDYKSSITFTSIGFISEYISRGALWFKLKKEDLISVNEGEEPFIIFEITQSTYEQGLFEGASPLDTAFSSPLKENVYDLGDDSKATILDSNDITDRHRGVLANEYWYKHNFARLTIFNNLNKNHSTSQIFLTSAGLYIKITLADFEQTDTIYFAIDSPVKKVAKTRTEALTPTSWWYTIIPPQGSFNVIKRSPEYKCANINHFGIEISKTEDYNLICNYLTPILDSCNPVPHKYGKFAYWESSEKYPDNKDLYDSSELLITAEDIPAEYRDEFKSMYTAGELDPQGNYLLNKTVTDLRCKPIRHFKFPDNTISPFIDSRPKFGSINTTIYPIGFTVDNDIIKSFLSIAAKNGLITEEQRKSIKYYKIYRGSRAIHKSVVFKGLANDMYEYTYKGDKFLFRNFPFNSLGENQLIYANQHRSGYIQHPHGNRENFNFSIIAPEIYMKERGTPTELTVEGYQLGYATGSFKEVLGHSKWVILGGKAEKLATTLATLQIIFDTTQNIGNSMIETGKSMFAGTSTNFGWPMSIVGMAMNLVINVASSVLFNFAKYKYEWLEIFKNMGTPYNFAYRYVGVGNYNFFEPNSEKDSYLRGLSVAKYMPPGMITTTDEQEKKVIKINNLDREDSLFTSFGKKQYSVKYPIRYVTWDNTDTGATTSSRPIASLTDCAGGSVDTRVGSPYVSLKVYNPAQYGGIENVAWLYTGYMGKLDKYGDDEDNFCKPIFGGDVYITRTALKNKYRMFFSDANKIADRTPFGYSDYPNIGSPRFYANYDSVITEYSFGNPMPYLRTAYNFNCPEHDTSSTNDFYLKPQKSGYPKFYLYYFGIPYFFTESVINSDYRTAGKELYQQFYPNVDITQWTEQEKNDFSYGNIFNYNPVYSRDQNIDSSRVLSNYYNKKEFDGIYIFQNGVVWSGQDNSEEQLFDPWLTYKPADRYQFSTHLGKLITLKGIESLQVLGLFENNALIFNAIDEIADRLEGTAREVAMQLGTGGIFAQRPMEFSRTDLGETGAQTSNIVSTEFGHFWIDAKRGKIFNLAPGGKSLQTISSVKRDGSPSGMEQWFRNHLPFHILKCNIEGLTAQSRIMDNKYGSLGIHMWWDSKFGRLFITKRDYICEDKDVKYSDDIGFYKEEKQEESRPSVDCPKGYSYNPATGDCEKTVLEESCPKGYFYNQTTGYCEKTETITTPEESYSCDPGYRYNSNTNKCEKEVQTPATCPIGFVWDDNTGKCIKKEDDTNYVTGGVVAATTPSGTVFVNPDLGVILGPGGDIDTTWDQETVVTGTATYDTYDDDGEVDGSETTPYEYTLPVTPDVTEEYSETQPGQPDGTSKQSLVKGTVIVGVDKKCPPGYEERNGLCVKIEQINPNTDIIIPGGFKQEDDSKSLSRVVKTPPFQTPDLFNEDGVGFYYVLLTQKPLPANNVVKIPVRSFRDVSWTVSYSPKYDSWISYHSFTPDYGISHNEFFQTGYNDPKDISEKGLWSHLLTNKSFQVYQGKLYPFTIEVPFKNEMVNKTLDSIKVSTDTFRYHNDFDVAYKRNSSFNKAVVFNTTNNSGELHLEYSDSASDYMYPKTLTTTSQAIKATNTKRYINFNYFFNRVANQDNNVPVWLWDTNQINKSLNTQAVSFKGKSVLERMKGGMFFLRLTQDKYSQFKQVYNWGLGRTTVEP